MEYCIEDGRDARIGAHRRLARQAARALLAGTVALAAGCSGHLWPADHLDRGDVLDPRTGDAQARNIAIHTVDPRAGSAPTAEPGSDGRRVLTTIETYVTDEQDNTGAAGPSQGGAVAAF